jgi:dTDP-4-amino-4,6-dideoxygalactose transaminase
MIPFSPPRIDQAIIDEVIDTLKSGWITTGPKTKRFEEKLTDYCGNAKTLCVSSATAGMELMLRWYGIGEGDEVIIPAYTYCATANVVIHTGAKVVMVDVKKEDFNINHLEVEKAITSKTKAIIAVDFGGFPADYDELNNLVKRSDIKNQFVPNHQNQEKLGRILVMSDAAHSLGSIYYGTKSGTFTDVTVFSFHAVKNLTTAEGGAIALNFSEFDNEEIYKELNTKSLHGQSKDALAKSQIGGWKYDVLDAGYKCNMTDIQAAIGLVELERYDQDTLEKRKEILDFYKTYFSHHEWAEIPRYEEETKISSYHLFPLRIKGINESQRDEIMQRIFENGVSVNVHFQPLPRLTFYNRLGFKEEDYPNSFDNYAREISLPVYYNLSVKDMKTIAETVEQAIFSILNV